MLIICGHFEDTHDLRKRDECEIVFCLKKGEGKKEDEVVNDLKESERICFSHRRTKIHKVLIFTVICTFVSAVHSVQFE